MNAAGGGGVGRRIMDKLSELTMEQKSLRALVQRAVDEAVSCHEAVRRLPCQAQTPLPCDGTCEDRRTFMSVARPLGFAVLLVAVVMGLSWLLGGCGCQPIPVPTPTPVVDAGADAGPQDECAAMCGRYAELECTEGEPTPGRGACVDWCREAEDAGIDLAGPARCSADARTCDDVGACASRH